ncbi:MAG TPA: LUD domain-containing protein [Gaiellaceae bacterium]|nr:LUD domain-containing protein [Gaiellaceae bacterium]
MSAARDEVLARVRLALAGAPAPAPPPRAYRREGARTAAERVALFCERAGEYRAEVRRVPAGGVAEAVAEACRERGARRLGVPPGLPPSWRPPRLELVEDDGLGARELDALDGVVTGCTVAIAETGTIALAGGPREGRRALTLVPDLHVCVVEERQVVELVPEATALLGALVARERRPVTLVSGPSATSDIELSRVEGVHGPRGLVVLVAADGA